MHRPKSTPPIYQESIFEHPPHMVENGVALLLRYPERKTVYKSLRLVVYSSHGLVILSNFFCPAPQAGDAFLVFPLLVTAPLTRCFGFPRRAKCIAPIFGRDAKRTDQYVQRHPVNFSTHHNEGRNHSLCEEMDFKILNIPG